MGTSPTITNELFVEQKINDQPELEVLINDDKLERLAILKSKISESDGHFVPDEQDKQLLRDLANQADRMFQSWLLFVPSYENMAPLLRQHDNNNRLIYADAVLEPDIQRSPDGEIEGIGVPFEVLLLHDLDKAREKVRDFLNNEEITDGVLADSVQHIIKEIKGK